jgi:hypothetical protein
MPLNWKFSRIHGITHLSSWSTHLSIFLHTEYLLSPTTWRALSWRLSCSGTAHHPLWILNSDRYQWHPQSHNSFYASCPCCKCRTFLLCLCLQLLVIHTSDIIISLVIIMAGSLIALNVHVLSSKLIYRRFLISVNETILNDVIAPRSWHKVRHTEDSPLTLTTSYPVFWPSSKSQKPYLRFENKELIWNMIPRS